MPIAQELNGPMRPAVMAYRRAENAAANVVAAHRRADIMSTANLKDAGQRAGELRRYAVALEQGAAQARDAADLGWLDLMTV